MRVKTAAAESDLGRLWSLAIRWKCQVKQRPRFTISVPHSAQLLVPETFSSRIKAFDDPCHRCLSASTILAEVPQGHSIPNLLASR
jgi:hypothetical protein